MGRRLAIGIGILTTATLAGCGSSDRVTYVDPNPPSAYTELTAGSSEPFTQHGADAAYVAASLHRIDGLLDVATSLHATATGPAGSASAVAAIQQARTAELPAVAPLLIPAHADVATQLTAGLQALERPTLTRPEFARAVLALRRGPLQRATSFVLEPTARQDTGFRAAVLASSITDASSDLDSITASDEESYARTQYLRAAASVLDARARRLVDVPEGERAKIQRELDGIIAAAFAKLDADPRDGLGSAAANLATVADLVSSAASIDPVLPVPDAATPDHLRSLKTKTAAALEAYSRGDRAGASTQLTTSARTSLMSAAPGVASIDPQLLVTIQQLLLVELPTAMRDGTDPRERAVELDSRVDEATKLVEDELELQREAS